MIARRGRQWGVEVYPYGFRHHFSHTWLHRGGAEEDLMELNGWTFSQMLHRYGASARSVRARRTYGRIMAGIPRQGLRSRQCSAADCARIDADPVPAEIRYSVMLDMEVMPR
jgi:integrase